MSGENVRAVGGGMSCSARAARAKRLKIFITVSITANRSPPAAAAAAGRVSVLKEVNFAMSAFIKGRNSVDNH